MTWQEAVLTILLLAAAPSQDVELGPHAPLGCQPCHVTDSQGRAVGPVSLIDRQERICLPCHDAIVGPQPTPHPVFLPGHPDLAIFPSFEYPKHVLPAAFPLDAQGRVTCSTCHAIHGGAPKLLRSQDFWNCQQCHRDR
jgi:predicted CXXCH cytochrome family protein